MGVKVTKSKNFDANLDAKRMDKQLGRNLFKVGSIAGEGANKIAPYDRGILRNSKRIVFNIARKIFKNIWTVPYANRRYYENYKNPHTRLWAKKDYIRNKSRYDRLMNRDIIKK